MPAKRLIDSSTKNIEVKDPANFSFAVFGGTKVSRPVFQGILERVDHDPDIAFAVDLGDTVLKGRKSHYRFFIKQIESRLGIPLLTVMGDNELTGDGRELYNKIFGPSYYSFRVGKTHFITLDNAGEKGPDEKQMEWLEDELGQSGDCHNRIIFMHRPLHDTSEDNNSHSMSEETSEKLVDLFLMYHVSHIFASQVKGFYEGNFTGIPYILAGEAGRVSEGRNGKHGSYHFLKVNILGDNIKVESTKHISSDFKRMKHIKYRPVIFMDHLIRVYWPEFIFIILILLSFLIYFIRRRKAVKKNED